MKSLIVEAKNLSNSPLSSFTPTIAALQDRLYVAWSERNSAGNLEIVFTKSENDGDTYIRYNRAS